MVKMMKPYRDASLEVDRNGLRQTLQGHERRLGRTACMFRPALFLILLFYFSEVSAKSQSVQISPDCFFYTTFTATGRYPSAGYHNTQGCVSWTVTYYSTGFTAPLSLRLDSAPDSSGSAGTWGAFTGSVIAGINPNTSITSAYSVINGMNPWVSLNLTAATGSGTISAYVYGCRSLTCASVVAAGAAANVAITGPFPLPVLSSVYCDKQAAFNLSGSGDTEIIAASGVAVISVCHISLSTVTAEDLKLTQGTGLNCVNGNAAITGLYKNAAALALDFGAASPVVTAAGSALCLNQSAGQATGGIVVYRQQ